jgi:hypothetical protein
MSATARTATWHRTCTNSTASYAQSQAGRSKMAKYEFLVEDKKGLNDLVIEVTLSLDHDSAIFEGAAK